MTHDVRAFVDGEELPLLVSWDIAIEPLEGADTFRLSLPLDIDTWHRCDLDADIQITIDDVPVLSGFVGARERPDRGMLVVSGRSRVGRLVQESVPGAGFTVGGDLLGDVIERLVAPWFDSVVFSNAENRRLTRGPVSAVAQAGREPALTARQARTIPRRVDAGESRWAALARFLGPLGLVAWSAGDGSALIVAAPNYTQAPQYTLYDGFGQGSNAELRYTESVEQRFATVEVSGSGRSHIDGDGNAVGRVGVAVDGDGPDGTGFDFRRPKRLWVAVESRTAEDAQAEAERILGEQERTGRVVEATTLGYGQAKASSSATTLFALDTVARVVLDEEAGTAGETATLLDTKMWIGGMGFSGSRTEQIARLTLWPLGTRITI